MSAKRRSHSKSSSTIRSRKPKRAKARARGRKPSGARRKPKKAASRRKSTARLKKPRPRKPARKKTAARKTKRPAPPRRARTGPSPRRQKPAAAAPRRVDFLAWLRAQGVAFEVKKHAEVYTAQEVAAVSRVSGYDLAKVVVLKANGSYVLAVLPAPLRVDFAAARSAVGAKKVSLASEADFDRLFPGCEPGAMPPFGSLWGLKTYVDESLSSHPRIVFNAGSHIETVSMAYADFERLARPLRVRLAEMAHV